MGMIGIIVALVAIGAMVGGAFWSGREGGIESRNKYYEPIVARATADAEIALAKNKELFNERVKIGEDIRACNQATAAAKADTEIAKAMIAKVGEESAARVKQFAEMQRRFDAAARTSTPVARDLSCEAARATLAEYSDQAHILDALGLGKTVTAPAVSSPRLTIDPTPTPTKAPPKSAIKTLGGGK